MQKFPLRMKDNDLLVTELYRDPSNDHITAISVYLTPKTTSEYYVILDLRHHLRRHHVIVIVVSRVYAHYLCSQYLQLNVLCVLV